MDKSYISIKEHMLQLQTEKTLLHNLRVSIGTNDLYFDSKENFCWQIDILQLATQLVQNQQKTANLFYGQEETQLSREDFQFVFKDKSFVKFEDQTLVLYQSLDGKLRLMINGIPSARSYLREHYIDSITSQGDSVKLQLTIVTESIPLNTMQLKLTNREEEVFRMTSGSLLHVDYDQDQNTFTSLFEVILSQELLQEVITTSDYLAYNTTVLDFHFLINSDIHELTTYPFRLKFPKQAPSDSWIEYNQDLMLLLSWYPTALGNFSSRTSFLKQGVFAEFENLLQSDQSFSTTAKNRVLISEYPYRAQDSGLVMFEYLMKNTDFEPYYVITEDSADYARLAQYGDHVVFYKSREHVAIYFSSDYLLHTHTSNYAMPFYGKAAIAKRNQLKKIFLQHGITAMKNIDYVYGYDTNRGIIDKFVVSTQREKDLVVRELGYPERDVVITGLARFDTLLQGNNRIVNFLKRKKVLIMPSWRKELVDLPPSEFVKTPFYKSYQSLLDSSAFREIVKKKGLVITFCLHANFQKYTDLFQSDFVEILHEGEYDIQTLMKNSGVMVTDYSSVGFDFALLKRSVIYFRFDEQVSEKRKNQNLAAFLPGTVVANEVDLLTAIEDKTRWNRLEKSYQELIKANLYQFDDSGARERIVKVMRNF